MIRQLYRTRPRARSRPAYRLSIIAFSALVISLFLATSLVAPVRAAVGKQASFATFNPPDFSRSGLLQEVLSGPGSARGLSVGKSLEGDSGGICRPTGHIEDAQCDYETVEAINADFFARLEDIVKQKYFRYYKVDLYKDCPFWVDNGLCMNRDCTVEKADESEVPEQYRSSQLSSVSTTPDHEVHDSDQTHCNCQEADFCHWDDENSGEAVYVDLLKNPERFTGYAGTSANRVWKSIYEENCFGAGPFLEPPRAKASGGGSGFPHLGEGARESKGLNAGSPLALSSLMASLQAPLDPGDSEICLEKRIFYRIISGLHASISIHICADHLDQRTGTWGPNLDCFIARISQHPERLQNVYFNYVLLLRALARAGEGQTGIPALLPGSEVGDAKTQEDLASLLRAANNIPTTFDEHSMFAGPDAYGLKQEFKARFRNVSSIMDCVGCDKCRLWGKLQTNGLATALKVLFSYEDVQHDSEHPAALQRSELVALLNTAHRFAESLKAVETFRTMYQETIGVESGATDSEKVSAPVDQAAPRSSEVARPIAKQAVKSPRPSTSDPEGILRDNETTFFPSYNQIPPALLQRIRLGLQRLFLLCRGSFRQCAQWVTGVSIESARSEL